MKNYTDKARKGNREAMESLFDSTKLNTVLLCRLLLQDEGLAQLAVPRIYRALWDQVLEGHIATEEAFETAAQRKTVTLCKTLLQRKNAKAFRIPQNRNFTQGIGEPGPPVRGELWERITCCLPPLHRFLYVLHSLCGYPVEDLARLMKTNEETVNIALEAEPVVLRRCLAALSWKEGEEQALSVEELHCAWERQRVKEEVPLAVDNAVCVSIAALCLPIQERRARKRNRWISVGAALVFVLCMGTWGAISLAAGGSQEEDSTASSTGEGSADSSTGEDSAASIVAEDSDSVSESAAGAEA